MPAWIALLRGINVGGRNKLPMAALRTAFETVGCSSVRTYIQSGNVVFQATQRSKKRLIPTLEALMETQLGVFTRVHLLTPGELRDALESNPFPDADPRTVHFCFLSQQPDTPDLTTLATFAAPTERFHLDASTLFLHAPIGRARSKLGQSLESLLGVSCTSRNLRTVRRLQQMVESAT